MLYTGHVQEPKTHVFYLMRTYTHGKVGYAWQ